MPEWKKTTNHSSSHCCLLEEDALRWNCGLCLHETSRLENLQRKRSFAQTKWPTGLQSKIRKLSYSDRSWNVASVSRLSSRILRLGMSDFHHQIYRITGLRNFGSAKFPLWSRTNCDLQCRRGFQMADNLIRTHNVGFALLPAFLFGDPQTTFLICGPAKWLNSRNYLITFLATHKQLITAF